MPVLWLEKWFLKENPFKIKDLYTSEELKKMFVNRELEVKTLRNMLTGSSGGVVCGISGVRGSGKSTLLNKVLEAVKDENGLVIKVRASGKYEELDFLRKLLNDICDQIQTQKLTERVLEETIRLKTNILYSERIAEGKESEASIRGAIKAAVLSFLGSEVGTETKEKMAKTIEREARPYYKSTITGEILNFLTFLRTNTRFNYVVIGIDETDKCTFSVARKLLDNIKTVLSTNDCHFIFVGTKKFHENFAEVFKGNEEEATFASIFEDIIDLPLFDDEQILEIINRRLGHYSVDGKMRNPFSDEAIKVILELAGGNPKQAMRLCSQGLYNFGEAGMEIGPSDLVQLFKYKKFIQELTPTEKAYAQVVKQLGKISMSSQLFFEELAKKGIEHKQKEQYRVHLERLINKKYLKKARNSGDQIIYTCSEICSNLSLNAVNAHEYVK